LDALADRAVALRGNASTCARRCDPLGGRSSQQEKSADEEAITVLLGHADAAAARATRRGLLAASPALAGLPRDARAQAESDWPNQTVRYINIFPPGAHDGYARQILLREDD
jgi:hypothetical protein